MSDTENEVNLEPNNIIASSSNQSTNNEIQLSFLTKFICDFHGDAQRLTPYIRNCQNAMDIASPTQKPILFSYIQSTIKSRAEISLNNRSFGNWNDLKKHLLETYSDKKTITQLQLELQLCKQFQNENISEFTQRVETCVTRLLRQTNELHMLDGSNDNAKKSELSGKLYIIEQMGMNAFILGVLPQYGLILRTRDPKSIREASQIALQEEKVSEYLQKISNSNFPSFCTICKRKGHSESNCRSKKDSSSVRFVQNQNNQTQKQYSHCNYCKRKGHSIQECRKREYNNSRKNNSSVNKNESQPNQSSSTIPEVNLNFKSAPTTTNDRTIGTTLVENNHFPS